MTKLCTRRRCYLPPAARQWMAVRCAVLKRDSGICCHCRCDVRGAPVKPGGQHSYEIHHLVPRCLGGTDELSNLCLLCCECHRKTTAEMLAQKAHDRRFSPTTNDLRTVTEADPHDRAPKAHGTTELTTMSLIATKSAETTWEPAPVGKWQAVCVDVRDEGMQANPFPNQKTGLPQPPQHKISIHFQLNAPRDEQGRLPLVSKWFTLSLWETAALPKFIADWFEISQTQIPDEFDVESLVGQNARIRIVHEPKKDGSGMRGVISAIEKWESEPMGPDNFTRKPGKGSVEAGMPQAIAPNPLQPLPPTTHSAPPAFVPAVAARAAQGIPTTAAAGVQNGQASAVAQGVAAYEAAAADVDPFEDDNAVPVVGNVPPGLPGLVTATRSAAAGANTAHA